MNVERGVEDGGADESWFADEEAVGGSCKIDDHRSADSRVTVHIVARETYLLPLSDLGLQLA